MEACQKATAKGLKIKPGAWGVKLGLDGSWHCPSGECCPLGAVLLEEQPISMEDDPHYAVAETLNVSALWVSTFTSTIDGDPLRGSFYSDARDLGETIIDKLLKPLVPERADAEPPAVWVALDSIYKPTGKPTNEGDK